VLVDHAWGYSLKYRERELHASQLAAQLAQAELQALRMQLHPHFLFNTLHTVSALMHKDVELADDMLSRLGDLLRRTLDTAQAQEVPLQQELEFIQTYLEIEQARLGSRLHVRFETEPETLDVLVPNLILQPLVENAVRHGIAPRLEGGRLVVRARRESDRLELEVEDDGPGLPADFADRPREGLGLANTRARLAALYGPAHQFELASVPPRGLRVVLRLPFREQADEPAVAVIARV
jgi:LytS/YehU family sensor histidine kinase